MGEIEPRGLANRIFWYFFLFYVSLCCEIIIFCLQPPPVRVRPWLSSPFMAGIILGGLFVLIAIYYFYNKFLNPFMQEESGEGRGYRRSSIYVWMAMWIIPPLILQCFVILGFLLTLHKSSLKGNIYCHPYRYGQIYKQIDKFNSSELEHAVFTKDAAAEPWPGKKALLESAREYLDKEKLERKLKAVEKELREGGKDPLTIKDELDRAETAQIELVIYQIPFLISLAFGFLGVLMYSLQDATHRLHTSDLYPRTFVGYSIRFIFALTLSITIAYFLMDDWWVNSAPMLFFFVGFFPQRALQFIEEKAMELLKLKKSKMHEIPLGLIQGMTEYKIYRFREIGVGNAQNLANINLDYLRHNLSYNDRLLCDFVSQAILLIHAEAHIEAFKGFGIRDIISFKCIVTRQNYGNIAQTLNIPGGKLEALLNIIEKDPLKDRIEAIVSCMKKSTEDEKAKLV